ncbi:uncharacterized protein LOC110429666 [Sorghum bicolor]|uniref:uncharacterized protein LOC110429666 n=1 Tax=Sorghum bicolor TaxID=4558 RepID=UPI00081ACB9E|nr:uncharacterized protein LOC110429666 [Sorghum bicolor]|eukprot:XP_021301635.1 uncharacterized protein LOC110429666 [Sorghum bicolor]
MSSGNRSQVTPAGTAPIAKGDKVAASTRGKKKAQVNRAKGSKWEQSTSSKRKVPDDTDDEESSDASFDIQPVQRNDERERMLLLEKTIEGAKKAAKFTIYRYADKAYNKVEESLDFVYFA